MKSNYALYGILFLCVVFAGVMGYMYFADRAASGEAPVVAAAQDSGRTVSGRAGKLVIAYTGDINGQLGPCG